MSHKNSLPSLSSIASGDLHDCFDVTRSGAPAGTLAHLSSCHLPPAPRVGWPQGPDKGKTERLNTWPMVCGSAPMGQGSHPPVRQHFSTSTSKAPYDDKHGWPPLNGWQQHMHKSNTGLMNNPTTAMASLNRDRTIRHLSPCVRVSYATALARWPQCGPMMPSMHLYASHPANSVHRSDGLSNPCG